VQGYRFLAISTLIALLVGCDSGNSGATTPLSVQPSTVNDQGSRPLPVRPVNTSDASDALVDTVDSDGRIKSTFELSNEGWKIVGDAQGESSEPGYKSATEDVTAHIFANDNVDGGTWYFFAPQKFTGNLLRFYGGDISFDLNVTTTTRFFDDRDVILKSGEVEINFQLPMQPQGNFLNYTIPLTEAGWFDQAGKPVDINTFTSVIINVQELSIRGEFNTGPDSGSLDNVVISLPR